MAGRLFQPAASDGERVRLSGTVAHVVYTNDETTYGVVRLRLDSGGIVTVAGFLHGVSKGQELDVVGVYEDHKRFGRQFKVEDVIVEAPTTPVGIARYLGSGAIPGIGPRLAERIVSVFGEKTLEVIDHSPELLASVPGIGRKKLAEIRRAWEEDHGRRQVMVFLHGLGIGPAQAAKIWREWRSSAVARIEKDPYSLTQFHGIGFRRADAVARAAGLAADDPRRLAAGVVFALGALAEDGHTAAPRDALVARATELLGAPEAAVVGALDALIATRSVTVGLDDAAATEDAAALIALPELARAEDTVARLLAARAAMPRDDPTPVLGGTLITFALGVALEAGQERAVRAALSSGLSVITGGPGTGKTTVVRAITGAASTLGWSVVLASPTGRASKRLEEATGCEAKTIHRLLGWDPIGGRFKHGPDDLLVGDLFVIDETSMVDTELMAALLVALPRHARLVLVGDADQLPSVGPGEVLRDVIASGVAEVVRLERVFRQATGGLIIENAHHILHGEALVLPEPGSGALTDFYCIYEEEAEKARRTILRLVTERIPERFGLDPRRDIQVLAPMYRGPCGTDALNEHLGQALNPQGAEIGEESGLRVGDRVIQTVNDYERDVFNGDLGQIIGFDAQRGEATVDFDGRAVVCNALALANLAPAYAISIHKAQGAEYPAVVVPLLMEHYVMLRRRLLYTAVTRAKRVLVLVGAPRAIRRAIATGEGDEGRRTLLVERLRRACRGED